MIAAHDRKLQVALPKISFALVTERYEPFAPTEEDRLRIENRQQLLREEEARPRILAEDPTGLWAHLLAGRDDSLIADEERDD